MNNKKSTKRVLMGSVVSLLLCVTMLIGTTFAWFTDSVTSKNNIIKSGNLDMTLDYWNGTEWLTVEDASDILDKEALWEPGYTDVVYLRLENKGTLAFKYQLGVNIVSETPGISAKGEFNLSDYIYFDVIEDVNGETAAYATREEAMAVTTESTTIASGYSKSSTMLADADAVYLAMVIYMPETVGNDANYTTQQPTIELGLNAFATQYTAEIDSFDKNYDAGAAWLNDADTDWYFENPEATEFTINTPEELAGLAAVVNGVAEQPATTYSLRSATVVDDFKGDTIKLSSDIDLNNLNWTPIGTEDNVFQGTFDGQGHKIANLKINAPKADCVGLFGWADNATIKNVTIKNANITGYSIVAAVVAYPYTNCTISNCHVTGKINIVAEYAYVAGIAGYGYIKSVDNCSVIADGTGTIMSKTRNAVGGITAWLLEDVNGTISNCKVKNLALTGWANIGAISGFVHRTCVVDSCSAENVVLTKTRVDGHPTIGLAAGGWSYTANKAITIKNNNFKNITLNGNYVAVSSANVLYGAEYAGDTNSNVVVENNTTSGIVNNLVEVTKAADGATLHSLLSSGETAVIAKDLTFSAKDTPKTGYGQYGVHVNGGTLDGGGNTLTVKDAGATWDCAVYTSGGTIKNITVAGAMRGIFTAGQSSDIFIDNVIFKNVIYTFNSDDGNKAYGVYVSNSTLNGWTSFSNVHKEVVFTDCSFGYGSGYAFCRPYNASVFKNCVFEEGYKFDTTQTSNIVLENCYYGDKLITAENAASLAKGDAKLFYNGLNGITIK